MKYLLIKESNLLSMTHNSENFGIDLAPTVSTAIVGLSVRRKCRNECSWQRFLLLDGMDFGRNDFDVSLTICGTRQFFTP